MEKVELVLSLRRYGARLTIVHDYWGAEHAMLRLPPLGWPRLRLKLSHQQARDLKAQLRRDGRPRTAGRTPPAGGVANQVDGL